MAPKKNKAYMAYTTEALSLLGLLIKSARKDRKMTEFDFADRVGISRFTLQKIEKGNPTVEIGTFFDAAAIAGIKLFEIENNFSIPLGHAKEKVALLPKRIRKPNLGNKDEF